MIQHLITWLIANEEWLTTLARIATSASAVATFFGIIFALWQWRSNIRKHKRERTDELVGRYSSPPYIAYSFDARKFLEEASTKNQDNEWQIFIDNKDTRISVIVCFSLFEEIGLMYNKNLIDKEITKLLLRGTTIKFYEISKWLIDRIRDASKNDNIYKEWEVMCEDLRKKSN